MIRFLVLGLTVGVLLFSLSCSQTTQPRDFDGLFPIRKRAAESFAANRNIDVLLVDCYESGIVIPERDLELFVCYFLPDFSGGDTRYRESIWLAPDGTDPSATPSSN